MTVTAKSIDDTGDACVFAHRPASRGAIIAYTMSTAMKNILLPAPLRKSLRPGCLALTAIVLAAQPSVMFGGATALNADDDTAESEAQAPPPKRIIVRVSRTREVPGYLESEAGDVITVRLLDESLETFNTARILGIIPLVDPRPDQTGIVILRNGQTRHGVIVEDAFDHVLMEIEGIRAMLPRDTVDRVLLEPSFTDQYEAFKQSIQPGMTQLHLQLSQWLVDQKEYELAKLELEELLRAEPMEEAKKLLAVVNAQIKLDQQRAANPAERKDPAGGSETSPPSSGAGDSLPAGEIISAADVNLLRVYEIDFSNPPKVHIEPDTIERLIENHGDSPLLPASRTDRNALFRAEPIDLARLMFELRARELYGEIQVQSEPFALNLFRTKVHNAWLIENCATSRCHGGPNAGRFFLHRARYLDERVRYTNMLILERLDVDPQWPLIDYDEPGRSLIIQYALPRTEARKPHPEVRGWRPVFTPTNKRLLDGTIQWINSMMQPRPEYPVAYEPPIRALPHDQPREGDPPAGDPLNPETTGRVPR